MTADTPLLLVIETSGRAGVVALARGSEVLAVQHLDEARRHARDLAPVTAALLSERGHVAKELAGVVVSRGPGSYTGLRVGVMSAKVLAYATGCALVGVNTFDAIARQSPATSDRLDVLADAQQDKVYVESFVYAKDGWRSVAQLAITTFAAWLEARPPGARVTGPGLHRWASHIPHCEGVEEMLNWDPQPKNVLAVGHERFLAGERDDPYTLEPLYLRPSSAEEQWKQRSRTSEIRGGDRQA